MNTPFRPQQIAIVGAGASGCLCAYFLLNAGFEVTIFDKGSPLRTLLPTGGGRCNLAHAEYDFKELAKNYPRGEKFLYSVFSKFSTYDTLSLFSELGVETYTQENGRIFPTSNSARDVREKILSKIKKASIINENVLEVLPNKIKTCKAEYYFTDIVIATGGHAGYDIIKNLDIDIVTPKPSLVGLNTNNKAPSGIVLKEVLSNDLKISDDLLFTHFGISGPLAYKISSIKARENFPYKLSFDLYPKEIELQKFLNNSPHKDVKNILADFLPSGFVKYILGDLADIKAHKIDGKTRDLILDKIHNFEVTVTGTNKGEETVTAGGVKLNEINPKTMEAKKYPHIYFIGEILDIDGFCGGFNLQNAWSTAFVAAEAISSY